MKVYFIPGLGADKRVFKHIQLPGGFDMVHMEWIQPGSRESLPSYAYRLGKTIDQGSPFALVGLSFGGMLATEISRQLRPAKTILIASIPAAANLPPYFKMIAPLQLHKILPIGLFQQASLAKRLFTTETEEDKDLLRTIIRETDPHFIRWALGAIQSWKNAPAPEGIYHIHGTSDNLLPSRYVRPTHQIIGGGHLMVMNRAGEVNEMLAGILEEG
ncbi:alpha/beta hydrolase [Flavihumibacter fluvii]|uniref:alpha/beta hydrolase n=1 Tax=Flavihumibacter fluvii TaxID=2838157 RepID=UPI001BDE27D7|nr:alpha/beta hydrolase [Flavihumibacter fluvii]ULQ53000.1 alpha/beta hydrolase [Flavihumibacter fluvii]